MGVHDPCLSMPNKPRCRGLRVTALWQTQEARRESPLPCILPPSQSPSYHSSTCPCSPPSRLLVVLVVEATTRNVWRPLPVFSSLTQSPSYTSPLKAVYFPCKQTNHNTNERLCCVIHSPAKDCKHVGGSGWMVIVLYIFQAITQV